MDSKIIRFLYFSLLAFASSLPLLHVASPTSASSSLTAASLTEYHDILSLRTIDRDYLCSEIFEGFSIFKFIN
ncbi:hypothetical protein PanWU01x14_243570 [Parasponia andersonii]|uniref:Transmembrane protein n=1 Tax=Parasponia andersonii TaxID=3476 RepID=A0A2P5BFP2_PARAD|nr:hypothetical protein PanWU01x14_243570 [Parasponia andersonii]